MTHCSRRACTAEHAQRSTHTCSIHWGAIRLVYRNCLSQGAQALRLAATLVHTVKACVRCCAPRGRTSCARNSVWACAVPERKSEGAQQFMADLPSTCVAPEQPCEAPRTPHALAARWSAAGAPGHLSCHSIIAAMAS